MATRRYLLIGSALGVGVALALVVVSMLFRHTFGGVSLVLWPTAWFFGSEDPEQQLSWLQVCFAVISNGVPYACLAALAYVLRAGKAGSGSAK